MQSAECRVRNLRRAYPVAPSLILTVRRPFSLSPLLPFSASPRLPFSALVAAAAGEAQQKEKEVDEIQVE